MSKVDAGLIRAWLAARSLARGLPMPVPDSGGWRVDTGLAAEKRRHVFPFACPGLIGLGETVEEPFVMLKLAGTHAELAALLPARWRLEPLAHVMTHGGTFAGGAAPQPPDGYTLALDRDGDTTHAEIVTTDGDIAASGWAAELDGVFIYDRIVTGTAHQRRGLGRAVMLALQTSRRSPASRQVLTATEAGRALYGTLGWAVHCPWSTAAIAPPSA